MTRPRLDKYGYNCIGKHIGMVIFVCGPLFVGAGTLNWDWAWAFTFVTLAGWTILSLVLARVNPELLNRRGQRHSFTWREFVAYVGRYPLATPRRVVNLNPAPTV